MFFRRKQPASGAVDAGRLPRHVAIIMDGNGRWATRRGLPRPAGHRAGLESVRRVIGECRRRGIAELTLFAFSSENWRRPAAEVGMLMELFLSALQREVAELGRNGVRIRFIGARESFAASLQEAMAVAEAATAAQSTLRLNIAANYGGRWEIAQAARALADAVRAGQLEPAQIDEQRLASEIARAGVGEPDLFIRTGGEHRISNFLLWQLAYTELLFSDVLWPDYSVDDFAAALADYAGRERRFGAAPAAEGAHA